MTQEISDDLVKAFWNILQHVPYRITNSLDDDLVLEQIELFEGVDLPPVII